MGEGGLNEHFRECRLEVEDKAGRIDNLLARPEQQFENAERV